MTATTALNGRLTVDESTLSVLGKAILFLGCGQGFEWALNGPIRGRGTSTIELFLDPVFGKYTSWFAFAAIVGALFYLALTALLVRFVEHKDLSSIGFKWVETNRGNFWAGIFAGFLPGLAIALVLVVFGLVEVVSYIHLSLLIMPFYALNMVLVASGYALQILLRRLPPWLAIAFVSLGSSLVAFGNFWVRGWKPILALSLTGSAISSELLGYAFWQRRSLWFPAGVFFGLRLAPTGGGLEFISWASRLEALRSSMTWNIGFGLPRILIFLLCALLLWRLSFLSGPDRDENSGANFSTSQEVQNGSLSKWFFLGSWTIASGLGLILVVSQGVEIVRATVFREDTIFPEDIKGLSGGALLASLFALIVFCLLLHKMWGAIEDDQTTVTPGKAVGFLFIPLFNIYWGFQAIARFPDEFNMYAKRHSINVPSLRSGLFLAYVILALMVWIPVLNIVTAPAMYIVEMVMIGRICDGVNAL